MMFNAAPCITTINGESHGAWNQRAPQLFWVMSFLGHVFFFSPVCVLVCAQSVRALVVSVCETCY